MVGAIMLSLGHMGVSLWKHTRRSLDALFSFVNIEVGDGSQTRF